MERVIKIMIWVLAIASALLRLLPSQVDAYSFFQKPFGGVPGVAVGTLVAQRPPHRSVRAVLPHTAPASGYNDKASE